VKEDVLQRMDALGCAEGLRAVVSKLPDDLAIVVKPGRGDFLPLAAALDRKAGVYMGLQDMTLMLQPDDAGALAAQTACRIPRINATTGYVRVRAADAGDPQHFDAVRTAVEQALRRSAGAPAAEVATTTRAAAAETGPSGSQVVLFRISAAWRPDMDEDELYDATHGWWRIGLRREACAYALAVAEGVVRGAFLVHSWQQRHYADEHATDPIAGRRWGFEGEPTDDLQDLVGLDVSSLFPPGAQNPVRYTTVGTLEALSRPGAAVDLSTVGQDTEDELDAEDVQAQEAEPAVEPARLSPLRELCSRLEDNEILHLSLGSKELFHSNLLGWFAERFPDAAVSALKPWLRPEPDRPVHRVRREHLSLDLIIELPGYAPLVIENKVFSLPDEAQLDRYAEKKVKQAKLDHPVLVLLSLPDPGWTAGTYKAWTWVPWPELAIRIAATVDGAGLPPFVADLVTRWTRLVADLRSTVELTSPQHLDEPVLLNKDEVAVLQTARIADGVQKLRSHHVRRLLSRHLLDLQLPVDEVESGFANKGPLLTCFLALPDGSRIGWQLQFDQWRRFLIVPGHLHGRGEKKKQLRVDFAGSDHAHWWSFDDEQALGPFLPAPNSDFKHYAPDFVYDYVRVPGLTIRQMLDLSVVTLTAAHRYRDRLASPA
jgi:hypothetical protein